jgi:secreted trypsin-like serine protease
MRFVSTCTTTTLLLFHFCVNGLDVTTDKTGFFDSADVLSYTATVATNSAATTRIVNGDLANKTRYPYYTALFRSTRFNSNITFFTCGGSLIQNDVVVTAGMFIVM